MNRVYAAMLMLGMVLCFIASIVPQRHANTVLLVMGVVIVMITLILIVTDTSW